MLFDGLISLLGGVYCTLLAFGIISPGKDAERAEIWHRKFGGMMKFVGPLLMVFGVVRLFGLIK